MFENYCQRAPKILKGDGGDIELGSGWATLVQEVMERKQAWNKPYLPKVLPS